MGMVVPIICLLILISLIITNIHTLIASEELKWGSEKSIKELGIEIKVPKIPPEVKYEIKKVVITTSPKECKHYKIGNYDLIYIEGAAYHKVPGEPQLPVKTITVKLPRNVKVLGIAITDGTYVDILNKLNIIPAPKPLTWHNNEEVGKYYRRLRIPKKEIYEMKTYFPGKFFKYFIGRDNEYTYIFIKLYPIQYIPKLKKAVLVTKLELAVYYTKAERSKSKAVWSFAGFSSASTSLTNAKHIIITPEEFKTYAEALASLHNYKGIPTSVVTTEWIFTNYVEVEDPSLTGYKDCPGIEGCEKIKNYNYTLAKRIIAFLRDSDAHPNLKYITILGTAIKVPPSYYVYIYWRYTYDNWIPTDYFYASPDYDLVPNYAVARIPINNTRQAEFIANKIVKYVQELDKDSSWFYNVAVAGGQTFSTTWHEGELVATHVVNNYLSGMRVEKLYASERKFSKANLMKTLQGDYGILYILTHGSGYGIGHEIVYTQGEDYPAITVEDLLFYLETNYRVPILITPACMSGAWDLNVLEPDNIVMYYNKLSFAEALLLSRAGGIAYIGSSRVALHWAERTVTNGEVELTMLDDMTALTAYVLEAYRNGTTVLAELGREAIMKYLQVNYAGTEYDNVTIYEFIILGGAALKIPPYMNVTSHYEKPTITFSNTDGTHYRLDFWGFFGTYPYYYIRDYNFGTAKISLTATSNTTNIKVTVLDVLTQSVILEKENTRSITFTCDRETMYLVRASVPDGKEARVYVLCLEPLDGADVLVVNDEPQYEYWIYDDYSRYYLDIIEELGYDYNYISITVRGEIYYDNVEEWKQEIQYYPIVIWIGGRDGDLGSYEVEVLKHYLTNRSGNLVLIGQYIIESLHYWYPKFLNNYLYIDWYDNEWYPEYVIGVSGDPIGDDLILGLIEGEGADNIYDPDIITILNTTYVKPILNYTSKEIAGVRIWTPNYRAVVLGFSIEAINKTSDRKELIRRILEWIYTPIQAGYAKANHLWTWVEFPKPFKEKPVVIAKIASEYGPDPAHVDIKGVNETGFWVRVEEDDTYDGWHTYEDIAWIAIEPGIYKRHGLTIIAETFKANHEWTWHKYPVQFRQKPIVVAEIMSEYGLDNCHIDVKGVNETGFYARVEEDLQRDGWHVYEDVAYIAIEPGLYYVNGYEIVAGKITTNQEWGIVNFVTKFVDKPVIIAEIMTENGIQNAYADLAEPTYKGFKVRVEEEPELDNIHVDEYIGYIAIGNVPLLDLGVVSVNHEWHRFNFKVIFPEEPVLVAQIISEYGSDNSHIDVRNVNRTSFEVRIEEDLQCDGIHVYENIAYLAILPGIYRLGNGTLVAKYELVNHEWRKVEFPVKFNVKPILIAIVMSENEADNAHIDIKDVNETGFYVRIEEDSSCDGVHTYEYVGYIAMEPTLYKASDLTIIAGKTLTNHSWRMVYYPVILPEDPVLIAQIVTELGIQNCHIDIAQVTEVGFKVRVEEEVELDGWHVYEEVDYLAIIRN